MVQLWPLACLLGDGDADRGSMPQELPSLPTVVHISQNREEMVMH